MSYECPVCGKKFKTAESLYGHQVRKHGELFESANLSSIRDEAKRIYLEGLQEDVLYWTERARLESKLRRAREKLMEPSLEQRVEVLEKTVARLYREVQRLKHDVELRAEEEYHDRFLKMFMEYLGKE